MEGGPSSASGFLFERGVVTVRSPNGRHEAQVRLHGAHVTSFKTDGRELLYLSEHMTPLFEKLNQNPQDRTAIRGGIPLIFPQFGPGPIQNHGFARNVEWTLADALKVAEESESGRGNNVLVFQLKDDDYTRSIWPHSFNATFKVSVDDEGRLHTSFSVANTGVQNFDFQFALHTYFRVNSISQVRIEGLNGLTYINKLKGGAKEVEQRPHITFGSEVDSVYLNTPHEILLHENNSDSIVIRKSPTLKDAVVWNPWVEKTSKMKDMNPNDFQGMVCIEAGVVEPAITLEPGAAWEGQQSIQLGSRVGPAANL